MVRLLFGLLVGAVPAGLELRGDMPPGPARAILWIACLAIALGLAAFGVAALRRAAAEERAYPGARRRWALSALSWSAIHAALLPTLAVFVLYAQNEVETERGDWPPREDVLHLPRKELLSVLSLGYREFVADLVWLRAIAYFGEHLYTDRKYRWLDTYLETVMHLDPRFRNVYKYAGTVTMYNLRRITRDSVMSSIYYLERGYRQFPDHWEFPFMICSNYLFEMPRYARDAAEKRRFQEIGAEYCREASLLPGALHHLPTMTGGVLSKLGKRRVAERHFREIILRTEDPKLRKQLQERYAALVSTGAAERLAREAETFFRAHRESFPYVPPDLFVLIGAREGPSDKLPRLQR